MTGVSFPSYFVVYSYRREVPSAYTESTVCLTPPSTASILLVALLKPVPVLNVDFAIFIFQKPICALWSCAANTTARAIRIRRPAPIVERLMLPSCIFERKPVAARICQGDRPSETSGGVYTSTEYPTGTSCASTE